MACSRCRMQTLCSSNTTNTKLLYILFKSTHRRKQPWTLKPRIPTGVISRGTNHPMKNPPTTKILYGPIHPEENRHHHCPTEYNQEEVAPLPAAIVIEAATTTSCPYHYQRDSTEGPPAWKSYEVTTPTSCPTNSS